MKNTPNKKYSLVLWYLVYRIPINSAIGDAQITEALERFKCPLVDFLNEKQLHPNKYAQMLRKRLLRSECAREHGSIQDGWCPPDPERNGDKRQTRRPIQAIELGHRGLKNTKAVRRLRKQGHKVGGFRSSGYYWKLYKEHPELLK